MKFFINIGSTIPLVQKGTREIINNDALERLEVFLSLHITYYKKRIKLFFQLQFLSIFLDNSPNYLLKCQLQE